MRNCGSSDQGGGWPKRGREGVEDRGTHAGVNPKSKLISFDVWNTGQPKAPSPARERPVATHPDAPLSSGCWTPAPESPMSHARRAAATVLARYCCGARTMRVASRSKHDWMAEATREARMRKGRDGVTPIQAHLMDSLQYAPSISRPYGRLYSLLATLTPLPHTPFSLISQA